MIRVLANLLFLILLMTGCGYRLGQDGPLSSYSTITVPYVCGDLDGDLTAAMVEELSASSCIKYQRECGQVILYVNILETREDNIGFRYDRNKDGTQNKSVIPDETRIYILAEFELIDTHSGCSVVGPAQLWASVAFDHEYYSSRDGVNVTSLGQVTDIDAARENVRRPLNRVLARKIVDYLKYSW